MPRLLSNRTQEGMHETPPMLPVRRKPPLEKPPLHGMRYQKTIQTHALKMCELQRKTRSSQPKLPSSKREDKTQSGRAKGCEPPTNTHQCHHQANPRAITQTVTHTQAHSRNERHNSGNGKTRDKSQQNPNQCLIRRVSLLPPSY